MSFQAKLFLGSDGKEFTLISAEYALSRPVDFSSRPTGKLRGGIIDIAMETGSDGDITKWILENMAMNGKIEFYRRDATDSSQKTVAFRNAHCVALKESFISNGSSPLVTRITISCHELDISNNTIVNSWAGYEESPYQGSDKGKESNINTVSFDDPA